MSDIFVNRDTVALVLEGEHGEVTSPTVKSVAGNLDCEEYLGVKKDDVVGLSLSDIFSESIDDGERTVVRVFDLRLMLMKQTGRVVFLYPIEYPNINIDRVERLIYRMHKSGDSVLKTESDNLRETYRIYTNVMPVPTSNTSPEHLIDIMHAAKERALSGYTSFIDYHI